MTQQLKSFNLMLLEVDTQKRRKKSPHTTIVLMREKSANATTNTMIHMRSKNVTAITSIMIQTSIILRMSVKKSLTTTSNTKTSIKRSYLRKKSVNNAAQKTRTVLTAFPNQLAYSNTPPRPHRSQSTTLVAATSSLARLVSSPASALSTRTAPVREKPSATMCLSGFSKIIMAWDKLSRGSGSEMGVKYY